MRKAVKWAAHRYRRWFQNRNYVFCNEGPFVAAEHSSCTLVAYAKHDEVPKVVLETISRHGGERAIATDRAEMADGAVLWVAMIGDEVAGTSMSRKGRHFKRWFVPLEDEDIVIFRNRTFPEHRGKGICPTLMRHIMHTELAEGGCAYVDCRVYNNASIRSIEKAGFERIGTMKPISRVDALGE